MLSSFSTESPKGGDHHVSEPINEELRYLYVSNVKVSNFVSVKLLDDKSNYAIWKKQMLCLLDSQNLRGFVDATVDPPEIRSPNIMKQYNSLVEGWIYGSLDEYMLKVLAYIEGPRYIWSALETICDSHEAPKGSPKGGDVSDQSINEEGGDVSDQSINEEEGGDVSDQPINEEELRYRYASHVNVSNFVSVSLLTKSNYTTWSKQMLCLLDSENLRGFVDATVDPPEIKRPDIHTKYENLVQGWILSSVDEDTQWKIWDRRSNPRSVWQEVKCLYDPEAGDPIDDALKKRVLDVVYPEQVEVTTPTEPDNSTISNDKLLKAVVDGRWLETKLILKNDKDAATAALTDEGETVLHVAVREGRYDFLEKLLHFIDDENIIKETNYFRETALHVAAEYNNKRAAQLLVKKCKSLLFCVDDTDHTALKAAYRYDSLHTLLYLWEAVNDEQGKPEAINHDEDEIRRKIDFDILEDAISTKQYGIASRLVNTFPQVAMQDDRLLMAMIRTFPSDLGFGEALICPSLENFHHRIVKRISSIFNAPGDLYVWVNHVLWATRSLKETMWLLQKTVLILLAVPAVILYLIYQLIRLVILVILYPFLMLYFLMWTVLAIAVMPIKCIEEKRKKYQEAKELVIIICNHIDKLGLFDDEHPCYSKPFLEAVCQGVYEVVDEILSRSPNLINCTSEEGYHCIQLAINNRSEKIYNLIHQSTPTLDYKILKDFSENNFLHQVGRLAPEHILSRTAGAALQLQRELQWFEVGKLMLPGDLVKKNADMETPQMVFSKQHAALVKEGEQWMKATSEACSITAALVVTIVFAAAITVPGGNDQETGIPLFKKEIAFIIFAVCDAISLFSAASALLVFLSILTTRFAEMDFLVRLPRRLIIGLCALFLSTTSMMVAFSAILFLVFCDQRPWMLALIGGLTCMPIAVIVILQLPLLVDFFKSTYIPIFGKQQYIANSKFISNHPLLKYKS